MNTHMDLGLEGEEKRKSAYRAMSIEQAKTLDIKSIGKFIVEDGWLLKSLATEGNIKRIVKDLVKAGYLVKKKDRYEMTKKARDIVEEFERLRKEGVVF